MDKRRGRGKKTEIITLEDNFIDSGSAGNTDNRADNKADFPLSTPEEVKKPRAKNKVAPINVNSAIKRQLAVIIDILADQECSNNNRILAVKHLKEIYDIL